MAVAVAPLAPRLAGGANAAAAAAAAASAIRERERMGGVRGSVLRRSLRQVCCTDREMCRGRGALALALGLGLGLGLGGVTSKGGKGYRHRCKVRGAR